MANKKQKIQSIDKAAIQAILAQYNKMNGIIKEKIIVGIKEIVVQQSASCKSQQDSCKSEIVNAAYEYKRFCNDQITEKIKEIMKYQLQIRENKKNLEKHIKNINNSSIIQDLIDKAQAIHTITNYTAENNKIQLMLKAIARLFFKKTSIFEHKINEFIGQIPIQIFVLTNQSGEEIGFFSYDGSNYEVLDKVASVADMSLKSGTGISFNMTMSKAQQIIEQLQNSTTIDQEKIHTGQFNENSLNGSGDKTQIINKNLANFIQIHAHQTNLSQVSGVEAEKLQEFNQTLNDTMRTEKSKKGNIVRRRRVKGLKGAKSHDKIIKPISIGSETFSTLDSAWEAEVKDKNMTFRDKAQEQKEKELFYGSHMSEEHFHQYFDLNRGQLKEGFFGYYFQLEYNKWTTVNSNTSTFLIRRTDLPSYIAAMDTVRARLWGDYNEKINRDTYAISVKSDKAGMDIKQFILLAEQIIIFWKDANRTKTIANDDEIKNFEERLRNKIRELQTIDINDSHAQKGIEHLSVPNSISQKGRNIPLEKMLDIYNRSKIEEKLRQQLTV